MGFASTGALSKILNDPAKRERMQQIAAGAPRTPEEQADYDAMQEDMAAIKAEQDRLIATGKAEDAARAKDRSWWDKTKSAVRSGAETFADAATGGGYSSVVAPALGYDSQSYAAPLIESTGLGDLNRKVGETAAGMYGADIDLKSPEERRAAEAAARGGAGGLPAGGAGIDADAREVYRRSLANADRVYTAGTIADPTMVQDPGIAASERVEAAGPASALGYRAAQVTGTRDVRAPNLGAATEMRGPEMFDAERATATGPTAATVDRGDSDQVRGLQMENLQDLREEAAGGGTGRKLTDAGVDRQLARISQEQIGAAGMARGAGRTAALREAMLAQGRQGLEAALAKEELGLQRELAAKGQLASALQSTRGQDVDLASEQARLDQQASITRAQLETAVSQGNAQEANRLRTELTSLEQRSREVNAAAANRRAEVQGQMGLEADTSNADRSLRADTVNVGAENASREFGTAAANTSSLDAARRADQVAMDNAGRYDTRATNVANNSIRVQDVNAGRGLEADIAQDNAGRGAFEATTGAQQAAISGANQAVGNRVDLINPTTNAQKEADAARARNNEFLLEAGTGIINNVSQGRAPLAPQGTQPAPQPAQTTQQRRSNDPNALAQPTYAAKGGIAAEPTIAGEAGPELVIPIKKPPAGLESDLHPANKPAGEKKLDLESELGKRLLSRVFGEDDEDMSDMLFAAALRRRKVA